jgi:uncharacterized protein
MSEIMGALVPLLFLAFVSCALLYMGQRRGFFKIDFPEWRVDVKLIHVLAAFGLYFFFSSVFASFIAYKLRIQIMGNYAAYLSWLNFAISFCAFLSIACCWRLLPRETRWGIIRRERTTAGSDFGRAALTWLYSFPLVLFVNQTLEIVLTKVFGLVHLPDQVAVRFLKSTFANPVFFILAVLSIVVLAPLIEETLFRGFLQSYIRRQLGSKYAILVTAACFSAFHFASGQGLGNISIIMSLFVLALFLGFLYEKQGSLRASIFLHGLFNAISVMNLYLFGGFSTL